MKAPKEKLRWCGHCGTTQTFEKVEDHDPPLYRCEGCGQEFVAYNLAKRPWAGK
jgi:uncharacterized Zn finger protein